MPAVLTATKPNVCSFNHRTTPHKSELIVVQWCPSPRRCTIEDGCDPINYGDVARSTGLFRTCKLGSCEVQGTSESLHAVDVPCSTLPQGRSLLRLRSCQHAATGPVIAGASALVGPPSEAHPSCSHSRPIHLIRDTRKQAPGAATEREPRERLVAAPWARAAAPTILPRHLAATASSAC